MTTRNRSRSAAAFDRAKAAIPGGVNSPARAFGAVGGSPLFIARGDGPYLFDLDGNRYLDFIGSWGPMILGHAHPAVLVIDAVPSVQMVRFVSSGTEATMSAIRLARGHTGRDLIAKFAGCYHGH